MWDQQFYFEYLKQFKLQISYLKSAIDHAY